MEYLEQTSGAIRLYLAKRDFNTAQFTILEQKNVEHDDMEVEFCILGESHYVMVKRGEERLYEICACVEAMISADAEMLTQDFLPNLHTTPVTAAFGGRIYSFTFTYADWPHGEHMLQKLRGMADDKNVHYIRHVFPPHDSVKEEAVTEVYVKLGETLEFYSVHTYPNEHMMVFTESRLE